MSKAKSKQPWPPRWAELPDDPEDIERGRLVQGSLLPEGEHLDHSPEARRRRLMGMPTAPDRLSKRSGKFPQHGA
jgi:hypothetical protein